MQIYRLLLFIAVLTSTFATAQNPEGYWDRDRATTKEIELCAGCSTSVATDMLPVGTTEIIYRITLLDSNQKLASSLSSVLKAIPDPSGISQGSAGAITLLSTISGDDKCTFAIFGSSKNALKYKESGKVQSACYTGEKEISKIAGRLTLQNSTCLADDPKQLWFGFTNTNRLLKEKIVLEVVPWVNIKSSRGWNAKTKQAFISKCESEIKQDTKISDKALFCQCLVEKAQQTNTYAELQQMAPAERKLWVSRYSKQCLTETGDLDKQVLVQRKVASALFEKQQYIDAIPELLKLSEAKLSAPDLNMLGYSYLMTKQYQKSLKYLKLAEQLDESDLTIQSNLAHAYLLSGDFAASKKIHQKYKNQNVTGKMSWTQKVEADFTAFEQAGLPNDDFKRIIRILK